MRRQARSAPSGLADAPETQAVAGNISMRLTMRVNSVGTSGAVTRPSRTPWGTSRTRFPTGWSATASLPPRTVASRSATGASALAQVRPAERSSPRSRSTRYRRHRWPGTASARCSTPAERRRWAAPGPSPPIGAPPVRCASWWQISGASSRPRPGTTTSPRSPSGWASWRRRPPSGAGRRSACLPTSPSPRRTPPATAPSSGARGAPGPPGQASAPAPSRVRRCRERLVQLEGLRDAGLVGQAEYAEKRREILARL